MLKLEKLERLKKALKARKPGLCKFEKNAKQEQQQKNTKM